MLSAVEMKRSFFMPFEGTFKPLMFFFFFLDSDSDLFTSDPQIEAFHVCTSEYAKTVGKSGDKAVVHTLITTTGTRGHTNNTYGIHTISHSAHHATRFHSIFSDNSGLSPCLSWL